MNADGSNSQNMALFDNAGLCDNGQPDWQPAGDITPPVITLTIQVVGGGAYTPGTWSNKTVVATFSCMDVGPGLISGIKHNSIPRTLTFNTDGKFTINPQGLTSDSECTDRAGNRALAVPMAPNQVWVDRTASTCTASSNRKSIPRNVLTNIHITHGAFDTTSGVASDQLLSVTANVAIVPATDTPGWGDNVPPLTPDVDGQLMGKPIGGADYTITYKVIDNATNSSTCSATVKVARR